MAPNRLIVGGGGKIIPSITIMTTTCSHVFRGWIFERCHFGLLGINSNGQCENTVILALLDELCVVFVDFSKLLRSSWSNFSLGGRKRCLTEFYLVNVSFANITE